MTHKQEAFQTTAATIIRNLEKRNMEGYFYEDSASCVKAVLEQLPKGSSISWGGSETFKETGLLAALQNLAQDGTYQLIDRSTAKTPEEQRQLYGKTVLSDYFFMSTNAITLGGQLINIDGNSNRVGCLVHGPRHVMILVGMNKIVSDVKSGVKRVQNIASPANAKRLNKSTPCGIAGVCGDCLSPECMCNQIVITRRSGHAGRIKVFFIAEELGY